MPTIHPRVLITQEARNALSAAALEIQQRYDLTTAEYLAILVELMASDLKYAIRSERHPEAPDTPGGWA